MNALNKCYKDLQLVENTIIFTDCVDSNDCSRYQTCNNGICEYPGNISFLFTDIEDCDLFSAIIRHRALYNNIF